MDTIVRLIVLSLVVLALSLEVLFLGYLAWERLRDYRRWRRLQRHPWSPPRAPITMASLDERGMFMTKDAAEAQTLLLGLLTMDQAQDYMRSGGFNVQTRSGRRYRICRGATGNISELDRDGRCVRSWCLQTQRPVAIPSLQLAQFLLLTTDEEAFCKIAIPSSRP